MKTATENLAKISTLVKVSTKTCEQKKEWEKKDQRLNSASVCRYSLCILILSFFLGVYLYFLDPCMPAPPNRPDHFEDIFQTNAS